jgi:type II secretory pathway pseudopilin PulG
VEAGVKRQQQLERARGTRGATLTEYALGVSVLVVASLMALSWLSTQAGKEAEAQADCISTRPPPTTCVQSPVPAPTTSSPPSSAPTTTSGGPAPTDPETTTTTAPPPTASATGGSATTELLADGTWKVTAPVAIAVDGTPVEGARVSARLVVGRQPLLVECTTDVNGACSLVVEPIPADVDSTRLTVLSVVSDPRVTGTLPAWDLTKP